MSPSEDSHQGIRDQQLSVALTGACLRDGVDFRLAIDDLWQPQDVVAQSFAHLEAGWAAGHVGMAFGVKDTDAGHPVSPHLEQIVAHEAGQSADLRLDKLLDAPLELRTGPWLNILGAYRRIHHVPSF